MNRRQLKRYQARIRLGVRQQPGGRRGILPRRCRGTAAANRYGRCCGTSVGLYDPGTVFHALVLSSFMVQKIVCRLTPRESPSVSLKYTRRRPVGSVLAGPVVRNVVYAVRMPNTIDDARRLPVLTTP